MKPSFKNQRKNKHRRISAMKGLIYACYLLVICFDLLYSKFDLLPKQKRCIRWTVFLLYGGTSLIWFYFQKVRIFSFECNVMANIFRFPFSKNKECARVAWKRPQVYFDSHLFLLLSSGQEKPGVR